MKNPNSRSLGGIARAKQMTTEEKHKRAKIAAAARWGNGDVRKVTHGSDDHPLTIGDIQIPCYVLEDETRVISQRGIQGGIGMSLSGSRAGDQRLAVFMDGLTQRGVDTKRLADRIRNPIKFSLGRGRTVYGYEATILADICDVILAARKIQGALLPSQTHFAERCELLIRGFARIGIIALIDEATGYQKDRTKDALARILDAFIASELQPWLRTFPSEFYQEMFRLRGLGYDPKNVKRPQYFGVLTNNVVYDRLAPGVKDELQRGVPRNEAGRPTAKYFQKLTQHTGYPKLREHLGSVVTLMKLSDKWEDFLQKMDRIHPKYNETIPLPLDYKRENDDGKGL
jgi:P63C domain